LRRRHREDRATFYRHDLPVAETLAAEEPHTFMVSIGNPA
jgi:hypothetical protein